MRSIAPDHLANCICYCPSILPYAEANLDLVRVTGLKCAVASYIEHEPCVADSLEPETEEHHKATTADVDIWDVDQCSNTEPQKHVFHDFYRFPGHQLDSASVIGTTFGGLCDTHKTVGRLSLNFTWIANLATRLGSARGLSRSRNEFTSDYSRY